MKTINVKIIFIEELLGSCPASETVYRDYIASKAPDANSVSEELLNCTIEEVETRGTTVFLRRTKTGLPTLSNHTWKGYFKEKVKYLRQNDTSNMKKFTAYKGKIDGNFSISPRFTDLYLPEDGEIGNCQRTLRADTAQGPIVSLASSETCPPGTITLFKLKIDNDDYVDFAKQCLDFGIENGTGQWRSASKGRFVWEELDDDGSVIGGNSKDIIGTTSDQPEWDELFATYVDGETL